MSLYGMLADLKIDPASVPWVPSVSNAAGLQELVGGRRGNRVRLASRSRALIEAGKVRSLAIMDEAPSQLFPNVPTVKTATGAKWLSGVWRGIGAPKNLPKPIEERLIAAIKKAYDSKEYKDFMVTADSACAICRPPNSPP